MKIKEKVPYITKTIFYFYIFIKIALTNTIKAMTMTNTESPISNHNDFVFRDINPL